MITDYISHNDKRGALLSLQSADLRFITSVSKQNVFRGIHFQYPTWENKTISLILGDVTIFLVDVDMMSPNFGKHTSHRLRSNREPISFSVQIKVGFGFLTHQPDTILNYTINQKFIEKEQKTVSVPEVNNMLPPDTIISNKDKHAIDLSEVTW